MPKGKPYPKRLRNQVIERIESGERLIDIFKDTGISPQTMRQWADSKGLYAPRWSAFGGKTLEIFKEIINNGYFMGGVTQRSKYILQLHFPVRKVRVSNRCIYFLEGNEELALKAFLENYRGKIVSGHELALVARAFRVKKSNGGGWNTGGKRFCQ